YLKREREERAAGHEGHEGLFRAAATSGQAVLISGLTVLIAMAGLLFAGSKIFTSIGIGAMLVVFTALVGSLTVLPALLGKLGDRHIERGLRQVLAPTALRRRTHRPRLAQCAPRPPPPRPATVQDTTALAGLAAGDADVAAASQRRPT